MAVDDRRAGGWDHPWQQAAAVAGVAAAPIWQHGVRHRQRQPSHEQRSVAAEEAFRRRTGAARRADPTGDALAAQRGAEQRRRARHDEVSSVAALERELSTKQERAAATRARHVPACRTRDPDADLARAEALREQAKVVAWVSQRDKIRWESDCNQLAENATARKQRAIAAKQAKAARLNARVPAAAAAREAWASPPPKIAQRQSGCGAAGRPAWSHINANRLRQQQLAPTVDPSSFAAKQSAAMAHAMERRASVHPMCWRWQKGELLDIQELRDKCTVKGLRALGSRTELEARLAFGARPEA